MCWSAGLMGQSNEGVDFWLGFMEHRDPDNSKAIMITSRTNTSGIISVPSRGFSLEFLVQANDVTVFNRIPNYTESKGSESINDNAIHIISEEPIAVYIHQYFGMRSEASIVLPVSSVGSEYYVIAYTGVSSGGFGGGSGFYPSQFLIVANEDETTISYSPSGTTLGGISEGTITTIVLNKGETYQVQSDSYLTDLTGTFIESDKDISLFAGTPWSQVPLGCTAMDNLMEQMYPVSTWGNKYVGSPFTKTSEDSYRVIASEDGTFVQIEGNTVDNIMLNAGEYHDFNSADGVYIESTAPISVAQYIIGSACNGGIGDPSMLILNTVEQIRDTVTLFNSRFQAITENYINVICQTGEEDLIFFDGSNLLAGGATFQTLGVEGSFSYVTVPTVAGAHTIYTSGCGIIAMAYGYGDIESYAYSGGASFVDINQNPIPDGSCLNEVISFDTGLPEDRYNVSWDLGDGTTTDLHKFDFVYPGEDTGTYPLQLIIEDLCFKEIDTLNKNLKVTLRQDLSVGLDHEGCVGTAITLSAKDLSGSKFEWSGPNDFESEEQNPFIQNVQIENAGIYEVVGNISGCKTFPEEVGVTVFKKTRPDLGADIVLCPREGDITILSPGAYEQYNWFDGSVLPEITVNFAGDIAVSVTDFNNCMASDTIIILQQCPTQVELANAFSPNDDGKNDLFGVTGMDIISMDFRVYDRWGQLVFETVSQDELWDGDIEGHKANVGVYVWTLQLEGYTSDATIFNETRGGTILLVR